VFAVRPLIDTGAGTAVFGVASPADPNRRLRILDWVSLSQLFGVEFSPLFGVVSRHYGRTVWATGIDPEASQTLLDPEIVVVIIRVTGANFRLLNRLLTQIQRILEINTLEEVTKAVVGAARESLVIGQV
jgi:hypothetical protein